MIRASIPLGAAALAALLLFAAGLGVQAGDDDAAEWIRPYAGSLPEADPGAACFLVRDARTGKPLAGVTVTRRPEMEIGEDGWAPVVGTWTTDAYGLLTVPLPDDADVSHWVFAKAGYGTTEEYGSAVHDTVDLEPGRDRHGRVVDVRGRPLAGLLVEHKLGCAHSPAVHSARTDANGAFVFRDVGDVSDVIVSGPGVRFDYGSRALRPLDMTPADIRVERARRVTGRVVLTDGNLLAPRAIVARNTMRGPLAWLGEDGSFTLEGAEPYGLLQLHAWLRGPEHDPEIPQASLDDWRPGAPILWRLGQAVVDEEAEQETTPVSFVVLAPDGKPLAGQRVHFDRLADNRRFTAPSDPYEDDSPLAQKELLPGPYEVSVGDAFARWVAAPVPFTHPASEPLRLVVREQARLGLREQGEAIGSSTEIRLHVGEATEAYDLDAVRSGEGPPYLPADAEAWVTIDTATGVARAPVGPAAAGRRIAAVAYPAGRRIEVEDIWPAHEEVEVYLPDGRIEVVKREGGSVRLAISESGRLPLEIVHPEFQGGWVVVDVPAQGDAPVRVDLAAVAWDGGPTKHDLVILPPAGLRLDEPAVHVGRVPFRLLESRSYGVQTPEARKEADGSARVTSAALRPGSDILVLPDFQHDEPGEDWIPYRVRLQGAGPYRIQLPGGSLDLEIELADPETTDVSVVVGGHLERWGSAQRGHLGARLRGLVPGAHEVLVGAPGHASRVARVVVRAGEPRRLRVALPRRDK